MSSYLIIRNAGNNRSRTLLEEELAHLPTFTKLLGILDKRSVLKLQILTFSILHQAESSHNAAVHVGAKGHTGGGPACPGLLHGP